MRATAVFLEPGPVWLLQPILPLVSYVHLEHGHPLLRLSLSTLAKAVTPEPTQRSWVQVPMHAPTVFLEPGPVWSLQTIPPLVKYAIRAHGQLLLRLRLS